MQLIVFKNLRYNRDFYQFFDIAKYNYLLKEDILMNIKEFLRRNCPDVPFVRKLANGIRINQYKKLLLSGDKVKMGEESYQSRC